MGPTEAGYIGGGMTPRAGTNTATVVVVECDDIDATLAEIAANGGAALSEKIPVGDMGFSAYFRDTEGNVVGLWENAAPA
ncbi:MAG: VOC family protein [Georgenia sp.]